MKYIDLFEEEFIQIRSLIITRMDEIPIKRLIKLSENYKKLLKEKNSLMDKYDFIQAIVENCDSLKETYTKEDMEAMRQYFKIAREMDYYERLEIYKLGCHDTIIWLDMIGLNDN